MKGQIANILDFVGQEAKQRHLHEEENSSNFLIDEIKNIIIVCCNTYLLLRKNRIFFWGENTSLNWNLVSILYHQNQLQTFICQCCVNRNLCISFFKKSFSHTDKYCQILILICKYMILIEHIHCLKGIYRILLHSSDILPFNMSLHCRLITPN